MQLLRWHVQIQVLNELMTDRGYSDLTLIKLGTDPFHLCSARDAQGAVVAVFISDEPKVGVKTVRKIREEGAKQGARRAILLCPDGLTPFATKEVRGTQDENHGILEVFKRHELAFNVTRHTLVPRHRALGPAERRGLLQKLSCKALALPKIKESDPVVRYYGFPLGTIVAIERQIGQLEPELYYRVVVQ